MLAWHAADPGRFAAIGGGMKHPHALVENLKKVDGSREIAMSDMPGMYYEIVATGALPGRVPFCLGRIVYSKELILAPLRRTRRYIYLIIALTVVVLSSAGFVVSRIFASPIEQLTNAAKIMESGNLKSPVIMKRRDEMGRLASSFNRMARMLADKIDELETKNIELRRLDALKDEFLANTSHELRTPISGIVGIAESMLEGVAGPVTDEAAHNLRLISTSGRRLSNLVNDILDMQRLKSSDISLALKPVNIGTVASTATAIIAPLAASRKLGLKTIIPGGMPPVMADEDRLQQVLINLLGNAVKFTYEGEVVLSAETGPAFPGQAVVRVSDTGVGIPGDRINGIFDSFVQADGSLDRAFGGVGLGLPISKKLVELHGGRIWAKSDPGMGSVFSFTLPLAPQDAVGPVARMVEPEHAALPSTEHARHRMPSRSPAKGADAAPKILVVDDEPVNLQVLINHLSIAGYAVETATDGPAALSRIEIAGAPDLVLLDVMMPGMNGYDVCNVLRERFSPYDLPVVMLTAKGGPLDAVAGLDAGANDYIAKPFDRRELLARVRNFIALKQGVEYQRQLAAILSELSIAAEIQESILPERVPAIPGVSMSAVYRPAKVVGGDFYDFHEVSDKKIGVLIGDVSGHGIPAALISSMFKMAFMVYRDNPEPASVLGRIAALLQGYLKRQFVTASYMMINLARMKLVLANAGHWPQLLWRGKRGGDMVELYARGRAIGVAREDVFRQREYDIQSGDRIVMFTDGLVECMDRDGRLFGEERLRAGIMNSDELAAQQLCEKLIIMAESWSGIAPGGGFEDDVCVVCVDVL